MDLVDQVDVIPKKVIQLDKQSRSLLHLRDQKIFKAGEQLGIYSKDMVNKKAGGYMVSVGKVMESVAGKYKETDVRMLAEFSKNQGGGAGGAQ